MTGKVSKVSGDVGNSGFNGELGRRNPSPPAGSTPGASLKQKGVTKLSTRLPYDSSKGEIRNHKGL
jgi:hypothetical protein